MSFYCVHCAWVITKMLQLSKSVCTHVRIATEVISKLLVVCKSCIYKYLADRSDCPRCSVHLGTNPFELIKFDRQMQAIVDKIFPELEIQEAKREREFYKERGIEYQEPTPRTFLTESSNSISTRKSNNRHTKTGSFRRNQST
jgi:polycomb group RING finger protein 3